MGRVVSVPGVTSLLPQGFVGRGKGEKEVSSSLSTSKREWEKCPRLVGRISGYAEFGLVWGLVGRLLYFLLFNLFSFNLTRFLSLFPTLLSPRNISTPQSSFLPRILKKH